MRTATNTAPGRAALTQSAWPSSMPSMSVSLTMRLLRCGSSASFRRSAHAVFPRLAAVEAPHDAADFERGVDLVGPRGIDVEAHHAAGEGHLHPLGQHGLVEPPPRLAAVVAPVDADGGGADVEDARPRRMHEDRPHLGVLGEVEPLPALAAIHAAVGAVVRAEIDHVRIRGIDGDRVHMRVVGEALGELLPRSPAHGAAEDSATGSRGRVRRAYVHVRGA